MKLEPDTQFAGCRDLGYTVHKGEHQVLGQTMQRWDNPEDPDLYKIFMTNDFMPATGVGVAPGMHATDIDTTQFAVTKGDFCYTGLVEILKIPELMKLEPDTQFAGCKHLGYTQDLGEANVPGQTMHRWAKIPEELDNVFMTNDFLAAT